MARKITFDIKEKKEYREVFFKQGIDNEKERKKNNIKTRENIGSMSFSIPDDLKGKELEKWHKEFDTIDIYFNDISRIPIENR